MKRRIRNAAIWAMVLVAVVIGARVGFLKLSESVVVAEVTNTMPKDGKYLVFTTEATYEITDSVLYWRFNSSDHWGQIAKGERYRFTVAGIRFAPLSWYSNIVAFERIGPDRANARISREHEAILKAIVAGDTEEAIRLLRAHSE